METFVKVIEIVRGIIVVTGLIWVLVGVVDFFGGRNNNDSMRQEKGANAMVNGGAISVIGGIICQAIITAVQAIK